MESNHHQFVAAKKRAMNDATPEASVHTISEAADKVKALAAKSGVSGGEVRVLTLADYKEAALSLAEAFKEDHTSTYFTHTPDRAHWTEQQRWDLHVKIMEYIVYAHLLKGLVVSAGPNYDAVALWMPPGQNMDDYATILRSGMWRLYYQLSKEGRHRFFQEFLPLLGDTKLQVLRERDQDSWYLVYVGTRPSGRGKGFARKVIEYCTSLADQEGKASYLESSHAVNLKIYERMGFKLKRQVYLQREEELVRLDIMVREPKVVGSDADSGVDVV
ncbi:putative N-acetyltransferase [Cercospora beticola]|uniref:Putative N-acetyltransferase n=1 Tax=Cercospora beticola TaxID=122368 RepID=A0A2G5HAP8_CERBT|nr:putative N-acetyltransferase [Cercospora beticola]PIA89614.1 putative N-acetyltransferase [Cercospora beticola]WPB03067.1 hypothetical protein RHO25_007704 [Cercospora beticola]CAK1358228.1 unnamed protein product [Cercospora beticola]